MFNRFGYYLDEDCIEQDFVENNESSFDEDEYANYDPGEDDYERDYFNALTDSKLGDYDDFDGNIDDIDTWARG